MAVKFVFTLTFLSLSLKGEEVACQIGEAVVE